MNRTQFAKQLCQGLCHGLGDLGGVLSPLGFASPTAIPNLHQSGPKGVQRGFAGWQIRMTLNAFL